MDKIEEKTKLAFVGNSHIAFWALNIYFPQWECLNYGVPGEGLAYVEAFDVDTSNDENVDGYVERYVKAVLAVPSRQTYLFCIFPRNDYDDYSTSVNKFICMLNQKIHRKLEGTDIIYLDVFDRLLQDGRLNPELTIDDLHLNGKGYSILSEALRRTLEQPLKQAPDL